MIHASLLAADVFDQQNWIQNIIASGADAIHVDIIDPSFANFLGTDIRITEKLSQQKIPFTIHYMAKWNDALIRSLAIHNPQKIFFHEHAIENLDLFFAINAGLAIELGVTPSLDVEEYVIMNVPLGYCGQSFQNTNLPISYELKKRGKKITSDGGLNISTLPQMAHFDNVVIGGALKHHSIEELKKAWK